MLQIWLSLEIGTRKHPIRVWNYCHLRNWDTQGSHSCSKLLPFTKLRHASIPFVFEITAFYEIETRKHPIRVRNYRLLRNWDT